MHRNEDTPGNERQERRNRGNQQRLAARGDEERRNETRPGEQGSLVLGQCSAGEKEHRPTEHPWFGIEQPARKRDETERDEDRERNVCVVGGKRIQHSRRGDERENRQAEQLHRHARTEERPQRADEPDGKAEELQMYEALVDASQRAEGGRLERREEERIVLHVVRVHVTLECGIRNTAERIERASLEAPDRPTVPLPERAHRERGAGDAEKQSGLQERCDADHARAP